MYISHKYKFVFLRSPKTASSSLSEFFIKNIPDKNAIYTPVPDSNINGTVSKEIIQNNLGHFKYFHLTLQELVDQGVILKEQAQAYRIITVIRDPEDRQKSFAYFYSSFRGRKRRPIDLPYYKRQAPEGYFKKEPNSKILQTEFPILNGRDIGEYWLYENLNEHLLEFMKSINVNISYSLPELKKGFRRDNEFKFDEKALDVMKKHFKRDFQVYERLKNESIHFKN